MRKPFTLQTLVLPTLAALGVAVLSLPAKAETIIGAASTPCETHLMLKQTQLYQLNKADADSGLMHAFRAFMSGYNAAKAAKGEPTFDLKRLTDDPLGARQMIALEKVDQGCAANPDAVMSDIFLKVIAELNAAN